jgi:hypothetical protein
MIEMRRDFVSRKSQIVDRPRQVRQSHSERLFAGGGALSSCGYVRIVSKKIPSSLEATKNQHPRYIPTYVKERTGCFRVVVAVVAAVAGIVAVVVADGYS